MDLMNNLVFTALNNVGTFTPLSQNFFPLPDIFLAQPPAVPPVVVQPVNRGTHYSYNLNVIEEFCAIDDPGFIESAIQKHWADMVSRPGYRNPANEVLTTFVDPLPDSSGVHVRIPPYHLVYAYLVENTRAVQIFERLIFLYMHDEKMQKATGSTNRLAFQWIQNTENLFFKHLPGNAYRNISSAVRPAEEATRRNAYYRLLGMDLGFGDSQSNAPVNFYKAEFSNQSFIVLFEKLLVEIWQAYTNARNSVGANSTDMFSILDTARKLQELLMSRRTTESNFENYRYANLSREEYSSVVMMSWIYQVISYNSPLVEFLRCTGNTPGERLSNIADKVNRLEKASANKELRAHSKSDALLDMAPPMNTFLRRIELGDFNLNNEAQVRRIIQSQSNPEAPGTPAERAALTDLLLIINNWQRATGHELKPEQVNGSVRIQAANGVKSRQALN